MPIIEQTATIKATTSLVLDAALQQLAGWCNDGLDLRMSVNISASNLQEEDFAEHVASGLQTYRRSGLQEFEIIESFLMENADRALAMSAGFSN